MPSPTQGGAERPDWKKFEDLAAAIQRELAPEAKVTPNARLGGRRSQTARQIDILVEQHVGQYELRIVIDCKDYKHPVDVKEVEEVIGLVEDVGAHKGAIIAAKGFTGAAKKRGADAGLDLYRLVDAADHKWRSYVTIPAIVRDFRLGKFNLRIGFTGYGEIEASEFAHMSIFRKDGTLIGYAHNLVLDRWEDKSIPHVAGRHCDLPIVHEPMFLRSSRGLFEATITFNIEVLEVIHFGQLPLTEIRGLHDEVSDSTITTGFTTASMSFEVIGREWQQIQSMEQLAIKPVFGLTVSSTYPRYDPNDPGT